MCNLEHLEELNSFGFEPDELPNYFYEQRYDVFAAADLALPALVRYAMAIVKQQQRKHAVHTEDAEVQSVPYPLVLDGVLAILIEMLRNRPRDISGDFLDQGLTGCFADWIFLFRNSSIFHNRFRVTFGLAVIHGEHQGWCQALLAGSPPPPQPEPQNGGAGPVEPARTSVVGNGGEGDLLRRMIRFCESCPNQDTGVRRQGKDHGLHGLSMTCLNIIRLKCAEVRGVVLRVLARLGLETHG